MTESDALKALEDGDVWTWNRWKRRSAAHFALRRLRLTGLDLDGVQLDDCDLSYSEFSGCSLVNSNFGHSDLAGVTFHSCNLRDADFGGALLEGALFENCELAGAYLESARGVDSSRLTTSHGDAETSLPHNTQRPENWESDDDDYDIPYDFDDDGTDDDIDDDDDDNADLDNVVIEGTPVPAIPSRVAAPVETRWARGRLVVYDPPSHPSLQRNSIRALLRSFHGELNKFSSDLSETNVDYRIRLRVSELTKTLPRTVNTFSRRIFDIWHNFRSIFEYGKVNTRAAFRFY